MTHNGWQIPAGRDLTDELPTKYCFSKFQFPVNEATKPDLWVFCCCSRVVLFSFLFFFFCPQLETLCHFSPNQTVMAILSKHKSVDSNIAYFPTFHHRLYFKNLETVTVTNGFLSNRFRVKG